MSQCWICGDEGTYMEKMHKVCCKQCADGVSPKMTRSEFDVKYWGEGNVMTVPASTRKEFYDDYLAAKEDFDEYKRKTTIACY